MNDGVLKIIFCINLLQKCTCEQQICMIEKYKNFKYDENILMLILLTSYDSYEDVVQSIDDYIEKKKRENPEKKLLEIVGELTNLRDVIGLLRENNIDEFDQDTVINVYQKTKN